MLWTECLYLSPNVEALTPRGMVFGGGPPGQPQGPYGGEETSAGSRPCELSEKGASLDAESVGAWISGSRPPDGENRMRVV